MLKILGICGSLREASWNRKLLNAAAAAMPEGAALESHSIGDLPFYNADFDVGKKPSEVQSLLDRINAVDALLFVTPEYNYGIPGVLKNAIDWASRPAFRSPLAHKPAGMMSASPASAGGARALGQLKLILLGTLTPIYPAPELALPAVQNHLFDGQGNLQDTAAMERLNRYLNGFVEWIRAERDKG